MINTNTGLWRGSTMTARMVAVQIAKRWGEEEVKNYNPSKNCLTYNTWKARGYQVKKGEHGLKSITFIPGIKKDMKGNDVEYCYPKDVTLFYEKQVYKVSK